MFCQCLLFFRLEVTIKENQTYESRMSALQATLKERSVEKSELVLQVDELRESLSNVETQNVNLQENVEELHKEVEQLKNFAGPLRSKKSFGGFSTPNIGGFSVGDISVDDPQFSPTKVGGGGEVIGNNLILDLREEIDQISEELKLEKEKTVLEVEKSQFLESRVATLENENARQQSEIEELSLSKASEIEKLHCQMNSELKRKQERVDLLSQKNEFLLTKISNLELEKEIEIQKLQDLYHQNESDLKNLSTELASEKEHHNLQVTKNETLNLLLSEAEEEIEQQRQSISEISQNLVAEAEKYAESLAQEKELCNSEAEKNWALTEKVSLLQNQIETQEMTIKDLRHQNETDLIKLSTELTSVKEHYNFQVATNETLHQNLSEAEKEIEQQRQSISELSQNLVADAEKFAESFAQKQELCNAEAEKNWALNEKVSTLQNQIEAQEMTLKEQSELMQAQVTDFEQVLFLPLIIK